MSTLKTTNLQHPDAVSPAIELDPVDGVVFSAASFDADVITSGTLDAGRLPAAALKGGFTASTTITATNAAWPVPTLGDPIVKVTVIGGGGGGGSGFNGGGANADGSAGGTTTFDAGGAGTVTATGGAGGKRAASNSTTAGTAGLSAGNAGQGGGTNQSTTEATRQSSGLNGNGGQIVVQYINLSGVSTVDVTVGAGGSGGAGSFNGSAGGRGEVIVEYSAGA